MSNSGEALVLCLYAGGTIGMVRKDASSGFAPYPSFLTETLRSQSRFHDPNGDSIFSWSDSVDRYKAWSEAFTRPGSGASTPLNTNNKDATSPPPSESTLASALLQVNGAASNKRRKTTTEFEPSTPLTPPIQAHLENLYADHASRSPSGGQSSGAPPFGHSVLVRSSAPKGTSTHHALSSQPSQDGKHLELQLPTLITPRGGAHGKRVRYAVLEYDPLLDSSEMDIPDWIRLASDISLNYQHFDAFIVLHGTDTMAYTASALSMLLENLGKSVIVTGAQVPLSELRNDAIENVLGALMLAGSYIIPEVGLYFASTLYRGNRTSKVSNNALAAFDSPNMAPLARVGINIEVAWNLVERSRTLKSFRAHDSMSPNVAVLRLFPGLPTSTVKSFLSPPLEGVILESYGAGNAPSRQDLLDVFKAASDRGLVIVNITQCVQGEVSAIYAVGKKLEAVGVVAGGDMTPECALAKLSYLLAKGLQSQEIRQLMGRPLRGELTSSRGASGHSCLPQQHTPAGVAPIKADVRTLLAHILHSPNKAQSATTFSLGEKYVRDTEDEVGGDASTAAAWDSSSHEVTSASLAVLPYLIFEAASKNDLDLLQWHLYALNQLETIPTISIDEEHFHPSTLNPSSSSNATGDSSVTSNIVGENISRPDSTTPLEKMQPLHISSSKGFTNVVQVLLQAGCSVHAREVSSGHSPLFLAAKNQHSATVRLLRNAGAHLKEDEVALARFLVEQQANKDEATEIKASDDKKAIWHLAGVDFRSIPEDAS
ncbi:related to l-asparaginase [Melanopsichium pennsylvanicum]|uniref:asparaginase n=2 Tax=Melanopsichium pennsylvanicum TaxID=63383 RepID=A0AAJ4XHI1_9BASI|nr:related to l-asparaginase [Melanopsichium pennsylvanicum 4]SNX82387.1 related to l-asparaginase [Melanopsichium pennsylvanicum]